METKGKAGIVATKAQAAEEAFASLAGRDRSRFIAMTWVKCNIIQGLLPINASEKDCERVVWKICGHRNFSLSPAYTTRR